MCVLARGRTLDQRTLGRSGRARNAAGSFSAVGELAGRVVLCDDVFTTGATLDAAAAVLLEAGAEHVRCAAVARAW
jgi:predicted amidophosphoribosyltransferase